MRKANTDPILIPGGMTLQLQVLHMIINKPFKRHLEQLYSDWFVKGNCALPSGGKQEVVCNCAGRGFADSELLLHSKNRASPIL
jgi:hypothetical protein